MAALGAVFLFFGGRADEEFWGAKFSNPGGITKGAAGRGDGGEELLATDSIGEDWRTRVFLQ